MESSRTKRIEVIWPVMPRQPRLANIWFIYAISPGHTNYVGSGRNSRLGVFTGGRNLNEEGRYQGETEGTLARDGRQQRLPMSHTQGETQPRHFLMRICTDGVDVDRIIRPEVRWA